MEGLPDIDRKTPEIKIQLGNIALVLTYANTMLYTFPEPYSGLNHVMYEVPDSQQCLYAFESPDLLEHLQKFRYPEVKLPYPTEEDIDMFINYSMSQLDNGIS